MIVLELSYYDLRLVAELTEKIKVKDSKDEESGAQFSVYFPALFLILRDFFLELVIDNKPVSVLLSHRLYLSI